MRRAVHVCVERGIVALLDRCEGFLEKRDPRFKPVIGGQPALKKKTRWKEGKRGWVGLDFDTEQLHLARRGPEGNDEGRGVVAKKALKEALRRAARMAMGKKREGSSIFARGKVSDRK